MRINQQSVIVRRLQQKDCSQVFHTIKYLLYYKVWPVIVLRYLWQRSEYLCLTVIATWTWTDYGFLWISFLAFGVIGTWYCVFLIVFLTYTFAQEPYDLLDLQSFQTFWANTTSTNCHWVLEHNSQIIGGVGLKAGASSTEGTLTRMFIVPEYRRQGLSTILLDTLVQHCKECRLKKVQLTTLAAQPAACAMYGKYGFIQGDTRPYRFGLLFHLTDLVDFTLPL